MDFGCSASMAFFQRRFAGLDVDAVGASAAHDTAIAEDQRGDVVLLGDRHQRFGDGLKVVLRDGVGGDQQRGDVAGGQCRLKLGRKGGGIDDAWRDQEQAGAQWNLRQQKTPCPEGARGASYHKPG